MIIKEEKLNSIIGLERDCTVSMKVDERNTKKLMAVLSTNLYQDPIGSIIREYCSNALDAQRENGNTDPITVNLIKRDGNYVFEVIDHGIGLSPERVENVFSKYLSSTKEGDSNQLGYYGLGSKSALSYVDSFMIHSKYGGKLYSYLMLKGEAGTELSLLDINDTDDKTGVTISIILKSEDDYDIFLEKIRTQLCYFEGVYINDFYNDIQSDYKIIKTPEWKYSELNTDNTLHLCLDNVYYALDVKKLGIEPIKMPIGLNFSLNDGITPIPSREGFMYTPQVKEMILNRIRSVGNYFIDKWNEITPKIESLDKAYYAKEHFGEIVLYEEVTLEDNKKITIKIPKALEKVCDREMNSIVLSLFPTLSIDLLKDQEHLLLQEYKVYGKLENDNYITKFGYKRSEEFESLVPAHLSCNTVYLLKPGETLNKEQIKFLKWNEERFLIIRQHSTTTLGKYNKTNYYLQNTYRYILKLYKKPKEEWRQIIEDYIKFKETYTDKFLTINDISPTQEYYDWKDSQKKERKAAKRNSKEQITIGILRETSRGKNHFTYDKETVQISKLKSFPYISVYCHENDDEKMVDIYNLFPDYCKQKLKCRVFSEQNYKKVQNYLKDKSLHNWIHIDDLWKSKIRLLSDILTTFLIHQLNGVLDYDINSNSSVINNYLQKKRESLDIFIQKSNYYHNISKDFLKEGLRIYDKNKWLNYNVINDVKTLCENAHQYDFLNYLSFNRKNEKELKRLSFYLYVRQKRKEKLTGIKEYTTLSKDEVQEIIDNFINPQHKVDVKSKEENDFYNYLIEVEEEASNIIPEIEILTKELVTI